MSRDHFAHCPGCGSILRVPVWAVGERAHCASCGTHFVVPSREELLEETFSTWIEHDVHEVRDAEERPPELVEQETSLALHEARGHPQSAPERPADQPAGEATNTPAPGKPAPSSPTSRTGAAPPDAHDRMQGRTFWPRRRGREPARPHGMDDDGQIYLDLNRHRFLHKPPDPANASPDADASAAPPSPADPQAGGADPAPSPQPSNPVQPSASSPRGYPQALAPTGPRPHLAVRSCDHLGARMAFDARWLEHEGFRGSMPMRCAFSGKSDRSQLIARPLLFTDRCRVRGRAAERIAHNHERRSIGDGSRRELARAMGRLEAMPHPFDLPMPYYLSTDCAQLHLHCRTHDRTEGGVTCEILIPDLGWALEWLGRVNGVCGDDYAQLAYDASLLHGEAWKSLPERCRQRLEAWCKLEPRELMRLYLHDADFGKGDQGLAGLVVTDRRLVYSKYHHRGQLQLNEESAIIARCTAKFAELLLQLGPKRKRMVKLHREHLDQLAQALAGTRVQLVVQEEG